MASYGKIFMHPVVVFELLLGAIVGWYPRWPIFRVLTIAFLPFLIAVIFAAYCLVVVGGSEGQGWVGLIFMLYGPAGFVSYVIGMLIGYLLRRVQNRIHNSNQSVTDPANVSVHKD